MKKSGILIIVFLLALNLFAQDSHMQIFPSKRYYSVLEKSGTKFNPVSGNIVSENGNKMSATSYKVLDNDYVLKTTVIQLGEGGGWINFESEEFLYDNDFNLVEAFTRIWDGVNWINESKILQTFNTSGQLEERLLQMWNGTDWVNDVKITYEYNAENKASVVTYYSVKENGVFSPDSRDLLSYSNNPYTETTEIQNMNNGTWENLSKLVIVYLDEERVLEQTVFGWDEGSYIASSKTTFTYEYNLLKQTTGFLWNVSQWDSLSKHTYTYDESSRMTEFISSNYESTSQAWQNIFRGNTTYWSSDSAVSVIQQGTESNNWENLFKTRSLHNSSGDIINVLYSDWVDNDWALQAMSETYYDEHDNSIEYLEKTYFAGQWENAGRLLSTYIPTNTTDVEDDPVIADGYMLLENFPNPFNPSTVIQYNLPAESFVSIKVYDLKGSEVTELVSNVQSAGLNELKFNAGGLSSGIYFYVINAKSLDGTKNFTDVKKMMMMK